jgi:hypothetical protein
VYEALGLTSIHCDEEKVIKEAKQKTITTKRKAEDVALKFRIKVVAKYARENGALWDALLLAIVSLSDFDEIALDVLTQKAHQIVLRLVLLHVGVDKDGICLCANELALHNLGERFHISCAATMGNISFNRQWINMMPVKALQRT